MLSAAIPLAVHAPAFVPRLHETLSHSPLRMLDTQNNTPPQMNHAAAYATTAYGPVAFISSIPVAS